MILAPTILIITLLNTDLALIILIFSMLLSPEFKLAQAAERAVVVRLDDILLIVVFLSWFVRTAIHKELGLLRNSALNKWILSYILICIISSGMGILFGRLNATTAFFYIMKYIEYFLLYFMVTNNLKDRDQIKMFMLGFLITGLVICLYAIGQMGTTNRVSAPFEGQFSEPNTLGGYLIILFAVCISLFIYSPNLSWKYFCGFLALLAVPPFIFTLSRGSYLAFIVMYLSIVFFSKRNRILSLSILIIAIIIITVFFPSLVNMMKQRIEKTFTSPLFTYEAMGKSIPLEESAAVRIESWKEAFKRLVRSPFIGHGVSGVGLMDTQYPLVLGETGIIGFIIFLVLMRKIFNRAIYVFRIMQDPWLKGLALGFLASFIGLLIQAFAANTFIIVRIMEPFWFLAAIVVMLPEICPVPEDKLRS